jgi:hypothetical protein
MPGLAARCLAAAVVAWTALAWAVARADEPRAGDESKPAETDVSSAQAVAGVHGAVTLVDAGWGGGLRGDAGAHGFVLNVGWRWHQLSLASTIQRVAAGGDADALYVLGVGAAVPVSSRWTLRADGLGGFFGGTEHALRPALGVRVGVERTMGWRSVPLDTLALTATIAGDVGGASAEAERAGRVVAVLGLSVGKVLQGPRVPSDP